MAGKRLKLGLLELRQPVQRAPRHSRRNLRIVVANRISRQSICDQEYAFVMRNMSNVVMGVELWVLHYSARVLGSKRGRP